MVEAHKLAHAEEKAILRLLADAEMVGWENALSAISFMYGGYGVQFARTSMPNKQKHNGMA